MSLSRRAVLSFPLLAALGTGRPLWAATAPTPEEVIDIWYRLVLELVRHTPTYSPPVASRAFAYLGVAAYEAASASTPALLSLSGQLRDLPPGPEPAGAVDLAATLHVALGRAVRDYFGNTGPTGQRAMAALGRRLDERLAAATDPDLMARSVAHGEAIAAHVFGWSLGDGGAEIDNLGFPQDYAPAPTPGAWVPTSLIRLQQAPLLPGWGKNRTFAMPSGDACPAAEPTPYSEEPGSAFHAEAQEVWDISRSLTDEQKLIARFWSDDPMLSPTPPGHWISIYRHIAEGAGIDAASRAEGLMRLGVAIADAFIGCWDAKYAYNTLRPVIYIRAQFDPKWEPLLITPPFPEYPSGHSVQSGAAEVALTAMLGAEFAFDDPTHEDDGLPVRSYPNFRAAAEEAAISRLYGGIHFRPAIDKGLEQGRRIGAYAAALRTRA